MIILLTIVSGFLVVVTSFLPRNGLYSWVSKKFWSPGILFFSGVKYTVYGKENLDTSRNMIYVSNHESHLDIPAVYKAIPVNLYYVAKAELKKIPFLGWAMQSVGTVFINRKDRTKAIKSLEDAGKLIKKGKSVISFPEGTRSKNGQLNKFKRGSFIMARGGNIDIVPIGVEGSNEIMAPGSFLIKPGEIIVTIGPPIKTADHADLSIEEFGELVRGKVQELIISGERLKGKK